MKGKLENAHGEALDYAWHAGATDDSKVVVIGHGVTANKDRAWARALAEAVSRAGYAALRFSFSGNGASEGRFEESTISKEVGDLGCVLDRIGRPVVYVGHSMGGAVGVLRASRDPRIERLVSLAGMVHTADFAERKFGDLTAGEDVMWDKPECPLSETFLADMRSIDSVLGLAPSIRVPWLLVHGTDDTVVQYAESLAMHEANPTSDLRPLDGADHLFSDQEPTMSHVVTAWLG